MYNESGTGNGGNTSFIIIEEDDLLKNIKTIEMFLAAIYTLLSAALTVIKFINQISKLRAETA